MCSRIEHHGQFVYGCVVYPSNIISVDLGALCCCCIGMNFHGRQKERKKKKKVQRNGNHLSGIKYIINIVLCVFLNNQLVTYLLLSPIPNQTLSVSSTSKSTSIIDILIVLYRFCCYSFHTTTLCDYFFSHVNDCFGTHFCIVVVIFVGAVALYTFIYYILFRS